MSVKISNSLTKVFAEKRKEKVILISGPTASGKSGLSLALAKELDAWIVNADSMQIYAEWRILTARPSLEDEALAEHRLYGHHSASLPYSVGDWLREVENIFAASIEAGKSLIIIGGTGLYFSALTKGLSPIPSIDPAFRIEAEAMQASLGNSGFIEALLRLDPKAASLDLENPRRASRAWEVMTATGRSITDWAKDEAAPLLPDEAISARAVLSPERDLLAQRISKRLRQMVEERVLDEVAAFNALALDPSLPATRAIGAKPFSDHLEGIIPLDEALELTAIQTRQYAKRQRTWSRNQLSDWPQFPTPQDALNHLLSCCT